MTPATLARMLGAANSAYRGRFAFESRDDLKNTAKVWATLLEDVTDEEGVAAFREHLLASVFPPTPADIMAFVKLTRVIGPPQLCSRCGELIGDERWPELDEDDNYLGDYCESCHNATHGGPNHLSLTDGLAAALKEIS